MSTDDPITGGTPTASAVAFRGPVFCSQDPDMWFSILECNFKASTTTKSLTKFTQAVSLIPPDYLSQVSDVVSAAINSSTPYEDLKSAILTRLQTSASARLQELLTKEELGNEKPTNLLHRMKKLLGDKYSSFDTDIFRQLYYQRLPATIQSNLFSVKDKLTIDELAKLADDFMSQVPAQSVSTMSTQHNYDQLASLVTKLTLQVDALQQKLNEHRSSSRSRSRSHSGHRRPSKQTNGRSTSTTEQQGLCFYHHNFGEKARKCQQPCNFSASGDSKSSPSLNLNGQH